MTALRKQFLTLVYGDYSLLLEEHEAIYAYTRRLDDACILVLLNFSDQSHTIEVPEGLKLNTTLISNYPERSLSDKTITLEPYQATLIMC